MIDYRQLSLLAVPAFLLFVLVVGRGLLFSVRPRAVRRAGSSIAGTLVQPTEYGKFLIIIFVAWYLSWFQDRMHKLPYLLIILILLGAPLVWFTPNLISA